MWWGCLFFIDTYQVSITNSVSISKQTESANVHLNMNSLSRTNPLKLYDVSSNKGSVVIETSRTPIWRS